MEAFKKNQEAEERFIAQTLISLAFVTEEYGFKITSIGRNGVTYASRSVSLRVSYFRNEVSASFTQLRDRSGQRQFSLSEIMQLVAPIDKYRPVALMARWDNIEHVVEILADRIRRYAAPFLKDEPGTYDRLHVSQTEASKRYTDQMTLRQARTKAEMAWREKDFRRVIAALAPVEAMLSQAEKRKLAYAKKQVTVGNFRWKR